MQEKSQKVPKNNLLIKVGFYSIGITIRISQESRCVPLQYFLIVGPPKCRTKEQIKGQPKNKSAVQAAGADPLHQ